MDKYSPIKADPESLPRKRRAVSDAGSKHAQRRRKQDEGENHLSRLPEACSSLSRKSSDSESEDMTSPPLLLEQETPRILPDCPLLELPVELVIEIMSNCGSPVDLLKLTLTCRSLRNIYRGSYNSHSRQNPIFHHAISNLHDRFQGTVPGHCNAIARYRKSRRYILETLSLRNRERFIETRLFRLPPVTVIRAQLPMQYFCDISPILEDAELVVKDFSTKVLKGVHISEILNISYAHDSQPEAPVLSPSEKVRFLYAVFQYDNYCNVFFYNDKVLFNMNSRFRQWFFEDKPMENAKGDILRFYSVVMFISTCYQYFVGLVVSTVFPDESTVGTYEERRYLHTAGSEILRFRHYLLCQGIRLYARLRAMDWHSRTEFLLREFYNLRDTHHPTISVQGLEYNGQGTHGDRTWTPWAHADKIFTPRLELHYRSAFYFWDAGRDKSIIPAVAG